MIEYWSNYTYEDELTKMKAISELRSWKERLVAAREEIKEWGVYYFFQEPMLILCQFVMTVVFWGILIYVYSILWPVLDFAEWLTWLFLLLISLCVIPGIYTGYYPACAIDTLITHWYIAKCDNVLSRIDRCEQLLK